jgi:hypothetical protein
MKNRREILTAVGGLSITVLSGCGTQSQQTRSESSPAATGTAPDNRTGEQTDQEPGRDGSETDETTDTQTGDQDQESGQDPSEADSEGRDLTPGTRTPVEATVDLFTAIDNGNEALAEDLMHPESYFRPVEDGQYDSINVRVDNAEAIAPNQIANRTSYATNRTDVEQSLKSQLGYIPPDETYQIVYAKITRTENGSTTTQKLAARCVNVDGEWKVLR